MSVTDTGRAPYGPGESRNAAHNGTSDAVTDTRTDQQSAVPLGVTCTGCKTVIPDGNLFVVSAAGRNIAARFRPGDPWCCDCANNPKNAPWLLPWRRYGARGIRGEYTHECRRCRRWFYGAMKRRYCSDACGEVTRNGRRDRTRDRTPRGCDTCGDTFTPSRADARYCSSACRQKAYRRRAVEDTAP